MKKPPLKSSLPVPPYITKQIEDFVEEYVVSYPQRKIRGEKVIHDALWGTTALKDYEVAILDLPLIQRLRQIHQTSLSYFTFPASLHSRFEHTLGVASQVNKLIDSLESQKDFQDCFGTEARVNLRLAALLHDCGHGPLSHVSEDIYRYCKDMQQLIGKNGLYEEKHPHEVLAHLIIKSEPFKTYLKGLENIYGCNCDVQRIADSVIGKAEDDKKYLVQIINGPFDADKIDYIFRDGHSTGLPLRVDLDRLWYCVRIDWLNNKERILVANYNGITPLEQILFCKIMLFSTIYHHPKVRATDCMFKAVISYIRNKNIVIGKKKLTLNNATDFLWITDYSFFGEAELNKDKKLHEMIHNILYRRLFVRALMICPDTITGLEKRSKNDEVRHNYKEFQQLSQKRLYNLGIKERIEKEIWLAAGKPCLREEVCLDVPSFPPTGETDNTYIKFPSELKKMSKVFPDHEWNEMYVFHKWKAHIFTPSYCQEKISKAAIKVLESEFDLKFNSLAWEACHVRSDIVSKMCSSK